MLKSWWEVLDYGFVDVELYCKIIWLVSFLGDEPMSNFQVFYSWAARFSGKASFCLLPRGSGQAARIKVQRGMKTGHLIFSMHTPISSVFSMAALPSIVPCEPQSRSSLYPPRNKAPVSCLGRGDDLEVSCFFNKLSINSPDFWFYLSVQFSRSVMFNSVTPWTAACQASLSIPTPGVYSNSCPLSQWCHPTIIPLLFPAFLVPPQVLNVWRFLWYVWLPLCLFLWWRRFQVVC